MTNVVDKDVRELLWAIEMGAVTYTFVWVKELRSKHPVAHIGDRVVYSALMRARNAGLIEIRLKEGTMWRLTTKGREAL